MQTSQGKISRWRRWVVALTLVSTLLAGVASPVLAKDFIWTYTAEWGQTGRLTFWDQDTQPHPTGRDWNKWMFQDWGPDGYTHSIYIAQRNAAGAWVTTMSYHSRDGWTTGGININLAEDSVRFRVCLWKGGSIVWPGCFNVFGWNS
jgi:hypothetical protein